MGVFQMKSLELLVCEVHGAARGSSPSFIQCHVQAYEEGVWKPFSVQRHCVDGDHICDHCFDTARHEVPGEAAGIFHAQPLLVSPVFAFPRRSVATDDHMTHVIHVNDGGSWARLSQESRCRALPDGRPSTEDERWSHGSSIAGATGDGSRVEARGQFLRIACLAAARFKFDLSSHP